jgi:hypothetical protein
VTFYVQKSLALGPIRFGVSPREPMENIDGDAHLSTGASGEFLRRPSSGFYFADTRPRGKPTLPASRSISSTPFLSSLRPADARGWGYIALIVLGTIFVVLGFAVVMRKGAQGWIEVILGAAMIATPLVLTAQKRRLLRLQEEKERVEREAREKREREMLASYVAALEKLRQNPNEETLRAAAAERESLDLPYEIWSPLARQVLLDIGFKTLHRLTPARRGQVRHVSNAHVAPSGRRSPRRRTVRAIEGVSAGFRNRGWRPSSGGAGHRGVLETPRNHVRESAAPSMRNPAQVS